MKEPKEICQRMLYFYDNLETTGWQVFAMLERANNEEDENAVAVVSTNSHFIQEVVGNE